MSFFTELKNCNQDLLKDCLSLVDEEYKDMFSRFNI